MFGDYESLQGGHAKEALTDMTGGVGESINLTEYRENPKQKDALFDILEEASENHSMITASIKVHINTPYLLRTLELRIAYMYGCSQSIIILR